MLPAEPIKGLVGTKLFWSLLKDLSANYKLAFLLILAQLLLGSQQQGIVSRCLKSEFLQLLLQPFLYEKILTSL